MSEEFTEADYEEMNLDDNIVGLVREINGLPGITTFSSCGGHVNPVGAQVPKGTYYISLNVDFNDAGWLSMGVLLSAIDGAEMVKLTLWLRSMNELPSAISMTLNGKDTSPVRVENWIAATIRNFKLDKSKPWNFTDQRVTYPQWLERMVGDRRGEVPDSSEE